MTELDTSLGIGLLLKGQECKGFMMVMCDNLVGMKIKYVVDLASSFAHSTSVSRGSSLSYDYSFNFNIEISTSSNPLIAGHPSDIIMGGGIDLFVNEALEGNCPSIDAII